MTIGSATIEYTIESNVYRRIVRDGLAAAFPDLILPPILNPQQVRIFLPKVKWETTAEGTVTGRVTPA